MTTASSPPESPEEVSIRAVGLQSRDVVPIIAAASGVAAIFTGQQPTGNIAADVVLSLVLPAAVAWIAQFATARAVAVAAVLAVFFSALQLPAIIFGLGALAVAGYIASGRQLDRNAWAIGASLSAALSTHAALHLSNVGFAGSASLLAALALAPVVITGFHALPAGQQRRTIRVFAALLGYAVIAAVLAVGVALSVRNQIEVGIDQAEAGVTAIEEGDRPLALSQLEAAQMKFEQSSDRLGGPLTWPARIVPFAAQNSRALETAADQGAALAATAARTVTQADVEKIRGENGAIDLAVVESVHAELTLANRTIAAAQESLREVNTPWLLPQLSSRLDSVDGELAATALDIDLANHATSVLPGILGANGQRRYLVLFVQPAESREFGGFVGAYGLLEVADGRFNLAESGSIGEDFGSGPAQFTSPEDFPPPYIRVLPELNAQNLTAVADLSSIAAAAQDLTPQWRENPDFQIDGVITIDPYALAGMLELTGPLTVDGRDQPLDATNVVDFLLRDQYIEFDEAERDARQDVLRVLAGQAFDELFAVEIPGPERLGAIFGPAARANRLAMVTNDPNENLFLDRIFLSADMPDVGSAVDMVGIFSQTATASKLDGYATRTISYDVTVDPATGAVVGELEIVDRNDAPADANTFVLGRNPLPGPDGEPFTIGDNFLVLGLYTRGEVTSFQTDGVFSTDDPLPAFSYSRHPIAYLVPLGETTTVTATLSTQVEPNRYDVFIPAQAAANPVNFTLTVRPMPGWRVAGTAQSGDGSVTYTFVLDEARGFTFVFEPVD